MAFKYQTIWHPTSFWHLDTELFPCSDPQCTLFWWWWFDGEPWISLICHELLSLKLVLTILVLGCKRWEEVCQHRRRGLVYSTQASFLHLRHPALEDSPQSRTAVSSSQIQGNVVCCRKLNNQTKFCEYIYSDKSANWGWSNGNIYSVFHMFNITNTVSTWYITTC